jgi:hypothetical protein
MVAAAGMRLIAIREVAMATWALPKWRRHQP